MSILNKNTALQKLFAMHKSDLAKDEGLAPEQIENGIENGTMVLLGNPNHPNLVPLLVGQPSRIKINANIGTSPLCNSMEHERTKTKAALDAGADTIMDLSTAGDLDAIRTTMLSDWAKPLGTVPIYSVAKKISDTGRKIESMQEDELFKEIDNQCKQGVDFITVHCGVSKVASEMALGPNRTLGIVSRGGSMLARWMNCNNKENPLLNEYDRLLDICIRYNVTLSLGDGLRPGAGCDAGDAAQWEEVINLGRLARYGKERGVQCMIEGPGHMPLNLVRGQIEGIKRLTNNAPLYVLGPLVCDSTPGYDHIAGAIGGAIGVTAGVDFLCYLTPAEHLTLPSTEDVIQGIMASKVAAHAGEVALGRERALEREKSMNAARKELNWEKMTEAAIDPKMVTKRREKHSREEVCAMCGEFCAVKTLRDITPKTKF
ncbi:MAG: phosphomethylpyrimidine synthase ThiC [Desulfovibrio sp.]|nr:phosphomethylpyrimidine synthase ThiC [Desulfovibrio sp.]